MNMLEAGGESPKGARTVIVTGGTSGIGRMIAEGFVANGDRVFICGRSLERCEEAARSIAQGRKGTCTGIAADLATSDGIAALENAMRAHTDTVHTLVNNAGVGYAAPIAEYTHRGWDDVVDLDLKASFFLTQKFLSSLQRGATESWPASVINIGSIGGLRVGPIENYAYGAAKAGLHHLTRALAKRLGPDNITVNAIAPGVFPSAMLQQATPDDAFQTRLIEEIPLRRLGAPADIASLALYLASPSGAYLTGAIIPLDGGMSI